MSIFLDKDEIYELFDEQNSFETFPSKYGTYHRFHIVRNDIDYIVDVELHNTEGIQSEGEFAYEAEPVIVTKWVKKK